MSAVVVVVGSINVDQVIYCDRVPDEGETLHGRRFAQFFGGKGVNQAVMAARMGADVQFVGCVGADDLGQAALANLSEFGVVAGAVSVVDGVATGVASIWVDAAGCNSILLAGGANEAVTSGLVDGAVAQLAAPSIVLAQLEIPIDGTIAAFRWARAAGAVTVLNPAPAAVLDPELLELTDWLMPNEHEFGLMFGGVADAATVAAAAVSSGCRLVVTMGGAGALVADGPRSVESVQVFPSTSWTPRAPGMPSSARSWPPWLPGRRPWTRSVRGWSPGRCRSRRKGPRRRSRPGRCRGRGGRAPGLRRSSPRTRRSVAAPDASGWSCDRPAVHLP